MLDAIFHAMQPSLDAIAAHPAAAIILYLTIGGVWLGLAFSPQQNAISYFAHIFLWPIELVATIVLLIRSKLS